MNMTRKEPPMPETCPLCGSMQNIWENSTSWECGSYDWGGMGFIQSDNCRANVLETQVAALTAERDRLREALNRMRDFMPRAPFPDPADMHWTQKDVLLRRLFEVHTAADALTAKGEGS